MRTVIIFALAMLAGAPLTTNAGNALIVFGNGIANTEAQAWDSKEKLKEVITGDPRFAGYHLDFDYAYNQTACIPGDGVGPDLGCLHDIFEAVEQTLTRIDPSTFWAYYYGLRTEPQDEFAFVTETANSMASNFLELDVSSHIKDLIDHVRLYRDSIGAGKKVVLVAHSQGNLFGNEAYTLLTPEEQARFGMVSVATPTNRVLDDYNIDSAPYTTLCEDPIYMYTPSFPQNLTNLVNGCGEDPANPSVSNWAFHNFINSYLGNDSRSKKQIKDDIEYVLNSLEDPPPTTFAIGDAVRVTDTGVNVRSEPNGSILGAQSPRVPGAVLGGPSYSAGFWWWKVNFEFDPDGWVVAKYLAPPPSTDFPIGATVEIGPEATALVWDAPDGNLAGYHDYEDRGTVVDGPRYSENYKTWVWNVNFEFDPDGWVAEGLLRKVEVVNGVCGTTNNTCSAGSWVDVADTWDRYKWNCVGTGTGATTAYCDIPRGSQQ